MLNASYLRPAMALCLTALLGGPAIAAPASPSPDPAAPTSPIEGTWLTQAKSQMTIGACTDGFCGRITKIVVPDDLYKQNKAAIDAMGATQFTDQMNKDPTLRARPILGLQILTLHAGDKPKIFDGDIYNPQDGNTYSGYVEVLGPDKIKLNGCILYNIICKGEEWTRVSDADAADDITAPTGAAGKPVAAAPSKPASAKPPSSGVAKPTAHTSAPAGAFQ